METRPDLLCSKCKAPLSWHAAACPACGYTFELPTAEPATSKVNLAVRFSAGSMMWMRMSRVFASLFAYGPLFLASVALFVSALFLPFAYDTRSSTPGWLALVLGWIYVFGESLAWLANPFLLLTWLFLLMRWPRAAIGSASISLFFAIPFIFGPTISTGWGDSVRRLPQTPDTGYFLWIGSILAGVFSAIRLHRRDNGRACLTAR